MMITEREREACRKWYWNHKEYKNEYNRQWYWDNKEKRSEYNKKWREENKEFDTERRRNYRNTPRGRAFTLAQKYRYEDRKHNRGECTLTGDWIVENIFTKPCAHCGATGWDIIGCNRLDESKPHTEDNVEPCCRTCNSVEHSKVIAKPVEQIDRITGEVIKLWDSATQAANGGVFERRCISKCCNNNLKTYKGYIWRYHNE